MASSSPADRSRRAYLLGHDRDMSAAEICAAAHRLRFGEGLEKNLDGALYLYELAAHRDGHIESRVAAAELLEELYPDSPRAMKLAVAQYDSAERAEHPHAAYKLAQLLKRPGVPGVAQDCVRAEQLFRRAAWLFCRDGDKDGAADAEYSLGLLLLRGGPDLLVNEDEAILAFRAAVKETEHVDAMRKLADTLYWSAPGNQEAFNLMDKVIDKEVDKRQKIEDMKKLARWLMDESDDNLRDARRAMTILNNAFELDTDRTVRKDIQKLRNICTDVIAGNKRAGSNADQVTDESDSELERYDVFISHAGAQKQDVAMPLKHGLEQLGLKCFLDEEDLRGSTRTGSKQLYSAMRRSRAVVFILTLEFASRNWPMIELREFLRLFDERERQKPLIIPLFYGLSTSQCQNAAELPHQNPTTYNIFLENEFFADWRQRRCRTTKAMDALKRVGSFVGLRSDGDEADAFVRRVAPRILDFYREEFGER